MTVTVIDTRQYPQVGVADLGIANVGASNGASVSVPPNAMVTSIQGHVVTLFNSETTATMTAGDGTTTFINAVDVSDVNAIAVGKVWASTVGKFYPTGGTVTFSLAETGTAATVGRAIGTVEYVVLGRQNTVQE